MIYRFAQILCSHLWHDFASIHFVFPANYYFWFFSLKMTSSIKML